MLKLPITYEDYNGDTVTDSFYFNLSKPELIEMEVEHKGGMQALIQKIIDTDDRKEVIRIFKMIVLMAYGEKSDDGKRFIKTDQLSKDFSQSAAYSKLFMDLATNDGAAATFLKGVLPKDMAGEIDKAVEERQITADKVTPPTP